jgi:hypothetical protein
MSLITKWLYTNPGTTSNVFLRWRARCERLCRERRRPRLLIEDLIALVVSGQARTPAVPAHGPPCLSIIEPLIDVRRKPTYRNDQIWSFDQNTESRLPLI